MIRTLVLNSKGGAGKTTVATNLASLLALRGTVLLADLDPQQSSSHWVKRRSPLLPKLNVVEDAERDLKALKKEETRLQEAQARQQAAQPSLPAIAQDLRKAMGSDLSALPWEARREIILRLIAKITLTMDATGTVQAAIQFVGDPPPIPS